MGKEAGNFLKTVRFDRPQSYSARLALRVARFALLLFLVVAVLHRFGLILTPNFIVLAMLSAAAALIAVFLAAIGFVRLWYWGAKGGVASAKALLYAAIPLAAAGAALYAYVTLPPIYDVQTELVEEIPWLKPPEANQLTLPRPPEDFARDRTLQIVAYPGLNGRRYEGALDRVQEAVMRVAAAERIAIVATKGTDFAPPSSDQPATPAVPIPSPRPEPSGDDASIAALRPPDVLLQGSVRTLVFGFPFDVMIRLREDFDTTIVDVRTMSRYGPHDLGYGARITDGFLRALDADLLGIAAK
jgi:hypothetical protein